MSSRNNKEKIILMVKRIWLMIRSLLDWRLTFRKIGIVKSYNIPIIILILLIIVLPQLIIIGMILALVLGYRVNFEKKIH